MVGGKRGVEGGRKGNVYTAVIGLSPPMIENCFARPGGAAAAVSRPNPVPAPPPPQHPPPPISPLIGLSQFLIVLPFLFSFHPHTTSLLTQQSPLLHQFQYSVPSLPPFPLPPIPYRSPSRRCLGSLRCLLPVREGRGGAVGRKGSCCQRGWATN